MLVDPRMLRLIWLRLVRIKENMRVLESKLAEAKTKKDMYIARARSAQASERMNEMLGKVGGSGSVGAFDKMEEKILELEARSEAVAEINELSSGSPLEKQFAALDSQTDDVDTELAALKAQFQGSNSESLPPANEV